MPGDRSSVILSYGRLVWSVLHGQLKNLPSGERGSAFGDEHYLVSIYLGRRMAMHAGGSVSLIALHFYYISSVASTAYI